MRTKRSFFVGAALLLATVSAIAILDMQPLTRAVFERWGWPLYDAWQRQHAKPADADLAVILITQRSLDEFRTNPDLNLGWPWPREVYGAIVDVAGKLDASSVMFDIVFDSPSTYGMADDEAFNQSLTRYLASPSHHVVFPAPTALAFHKPTSKILGALDSRLTYGAVDIPVEEDGVYRRVPRKFKGQGGATYLPFGTALLRSQMKVDDSEVLDPRWLRFYQADSIPVVDASEVFRLYQSEMHGGPTDAQTERARGVLKGKNWMIGLAAAGLYDLRPLPTDARAPGVMLHATTFLNRWHNEQIDQVQTFGSAVVHFLLGAILVFLALVALRPGPALIGAVSILFLALPLASWVCWLGGWWFNPLPGILGLGLMLAAFLTYRFQTEWRERERFAKSIENSMSTSMVKMIRSGELNLARFGERRTISILFSDLSGFTTLAEQTDPAKLVEILNLYLDECVDLVFHHAGYVDKFIGDAIMALWGAPVVGQTDHAKLALRTALEYEAAVGRFNAKARERYGFDRDLFTARVGLHSGPAIVGNIGSHSRYNYTAIGDSVNLASRLEGLGKYYGLTLLISEDALVEAGALQSPDVFLVDRVAVKGRSQAVAVYSRTEGYLNTSIEHYRRAFEHYQKSEWKLATEALVQAKDLPPSEILLERCQEAIDRGAIVHPNRQLKEK
jgi:adenylate cyclase